MEAIKTLAGMERWIEAGIDLLLRMSNWEEVVSVLPTMGGQAEPSIDVPKVLEVERASMGRGMSVEYHQPPGGSLHPYSIGPCASCSLPDCKWKHTDGCWWGSRPPCSYCKGIVGVLGEFSVEKRV